MKGGSPANLMDKVPPEATNSMFKSEREGGITTSGFLEHQPSRTLGPGGRLVPECYLVTMRKGPEAGGEQRDF